MLFLWALLCEKLELAEIFWQSSGDEGMIFALIGSAACNYIGTLTLPFERRQKLKIFERKFEVRAQITV